MAPKKKTVTTIKTPSVSSSSPLSLLHPCLQALSQINTHSTPPTPKQLPSPSDLLHDIYALQPGKIYLEPDFFLRATTQFHASQLKKQQHLKSPHSAQLPDASSTSSSSSKPPPPPRRTQPSRAAKRKVPYKQETSVLPPVKKSKTTTDETRPVPATAADTLISLSTFQLRLARAIQGHLKGPSCDEVVCAGWDGVPVEELLEPVMLREALRLGDTRDGSSSKTVPVAVLKQQKAAGLAWEKVLEERRGWWDARKARMRKQKFQRAPLAEMQISPTLGSWPVKPGNGKDVGEMKEEVVEFEGVRAVVCGWEDREKKEGLWGMRIRVL